jgi:catechol 2,3-dioxygenase-like lactoylglutathione lyase family enzyme
MIGGLYGAHILLYSPDADADRAFFRDVLDLGSVDAGRGWLIFGLPPSELAVHPSGDGGPSPGPDGMLGAHLYLMCDDVRALAERLNERNVKCAPLSEERWGIRTTVRLPSGSQIGLYQPKHPTAI